MGWPFVEGGGVLHCTVKYAQKRVTDTCQLVCAYFTISLL